MRILILGYFYPPAYSGEATYTEQLMRGLRFQGHSVTAIVAASPCADATEPNEGIVRLADPKVDRFRHFERYRAAFGRRLTRAIERLDGNWDVIHVQEWFAAEAAIAVAGSLDVPLVKTVHFIPRDAAARDGDRWTQADQWQAASCRAAQRIITVGHHLKQRVVRLYEIGEDLIDVVHNGIDSAAIDSGIRQKLGHRFSDLAHASPWIVMCGRLTREKGVDIFIRSAASVARDLDARWIVCGGSSSERDALPQFAELARSLGVPATFTGHVPRSEALEWLAAADVVVAPSRFEAFGLSVLEAMHASRPIVAAAVGGLAELIEDEHSGLLVHGHRSAENHVQVSPTDVARAQLRVIGDSGLARTLGANAKTRAESMFGFDRFIDGTVRAYRSAISGR